MLKYAGHQAVTFFALPLLMIIVIVGTVSQKWLGLHGALETYFYAPLFWLGPLPLPGAILVLGVIFINLLARFIGYSVWSWRKAGIHLSHLGFLLLLVGGIVSAFTRTDTVMPIAEGDIVSTSQSYDESQFVIYKNDIPIITKRFSDIENGLNTENLPFDIQFINACLNCEIKLREQSQDGWVGAAAKMALHNAPPERDPEANLTGVSFEVTAEENYGKYLTFLHFPKPPEITIKEDTYRFEVIRLTYPLPFKVKLTDFRKITYDGTNKPKSYESDIKIIDGQAEFPARISMNNPFTYKGYTLYQSSFQVTPDGTEVSVLATVYNTGRYFPYIACLLMAIGLLLHLGIRYISPVTITNKKALAAFIIGGLFFTSPTSHAYAFEVGEDFQSLPILYEGRVQPIDSFSRNILSGLSANEMAEIIFAPTQAIKKPVFKIDTPALLISLGLESDPSQKISFQKLSPGLDKTREQFFTLLEKEKSAQDLSPTEKDLINIHTQGLMYLQLLRSFSFAMPLGIEQGKMITYKDLQKDSVFLREALNNTLKEKGTDINTLSEDEQKTAFLNYQIDIMEKSGEGNVLWRVIPKEDSFVAPWQIISSGQGTPAIGKIMSLWTDLLEAYQKQNEEKFQKTAADLSRIYESYAPVANLKLERLYNMAALLQISIGIALLSAMLLILYNTSSYLPFRKIALGTGLLTPVLIGADICIRIILLGRPPVGTLYESMVFVAFILSALSFYFMALKNKNDVAVFGFSMTALILLSSRFLPSGQTDLTVLDAVLSTNFWLATHVLIISIGYGWCLLTSGMAHIALLHGQTDRSMQSLHTHTLISLLLVSIGTILGGIWADMSWGRFWGWDPKENGALLICIWLVWVIHARISNHLNTLWYTTLLAGLSIPVALAWFGVNLLNVGLHSYGFVSGIATGLLSFILVQTGLLVFLFLKSKDKWQEK